MSTHAFAFLVKSYAKDLAYAQRLVSSFLRFRNGVIPLFIVVPDDDMVAFLALEGIDAEGISVLPESLFNSHLVSEPVHGLRPGYINQEIVKLAFWELGFTENYFCVDSEAEFIRPFSTSDFLVTPTEPYSVLVQDLDLHADPTYFHQYWTTREAEIRRIADLIGWTDPVIRTCHGHTVFSRLVLESFRDDFLAPRGWDYRDALAEAPYEFSWYSLWLQKSNVIPIHAREPWIKVFHTEEEYLAAVGRGLTRENLARAYLGVLVNANFCRDIGLLDADLSKPAIVARSLSYQELLDVMQRKIVASTRRLLRRGS